MFHTRSRRRRVAVFTVAALAAVAAGGLSGAIEVHHPAEAAGSSAIYIDDSMQSTLSSDWQTVANSQNQNLLNNPLQSAPGGTGDDTGGKWLTLTDDGAKGPAGGESGFAVNNHTFSSSQGVVLEYDQRIFRTNDGTNNTGAGDGLSVFLVDGDIADSTAANGFSNGSGVGTNIDTTTNEAGGPGAGLGYASDSVTGNGWCTNFQGVAGGWIGLGFDVFGNYQKAESSTSAFSSANPATRPESVSGGSPDAIDKRLPESIGLRGSGVRHTGNPGSCTAPNGSSQADLTYWYGMNRSGGGTDTPVTNGGYKWLAGTGSLGSGYLDNDLDSSQYYRKVKVTITPSADGHHEIRVSMSGKLNVNNDVCADGSSPCTDYESPAGVTLNPVFSYEMGSSSSQYQADIPSTFKIGFAASTGYAVDYHQVRNVRVTTLTDLSVDKSVALDAGTPNYADTATAQDGDKVTYRLVAHNNGPTDLETDFPATLVDGLSGLPLDDVTWTATASGGAQVYDSGSSAWVTGLSGSGAITSAHPLRWVAPADPAATVTVTITAKVTSSAAAGDYPNTAVVTADTAGGPQEGDQSNNTDTATLTVVPPDAWGITKTSDPASGTVVAAGQTIDYTVTAKAAGESGHGGVHGVVLSDDLSKVKQFADFTSGSATLTIGTGTPTAVADPAGGVLTAGPFDLANGETAKLKYSVTVTDPAKAGSFDNVVTGASDSGDPTTCASDIDTDNPPAACSTDHSILQMQVRKRGLDGAGNPVVTDGSAWSVLADDAGAPGSAVISDLPAATDGGSPVTGLFSATGLAAPGTYWLQETRAPHGYELLPKPIGFTLAADGSVTLLDPSADPMASVTTVDGIVTVSVDDVPQLVLPDAGGSGLGFAVTWGGLLIILLVLVVSVLMWRRNSGDHDDHSEE